MERFLSRVSRVWRIVLILVVIGVSNIVIAVIQMVSPQLWRRHRPPGSSASRDAGTRH